MMPLTRLNGWQILLMLCSAVLAREDPILQDDLVNKTTRIEILF